MSERRDAVGFVALHALILIIVNPNLNCPDLCTGSLTRYHLRSELFDDIFGPLHAALYIVELTRFTWTSKLWHSTCGCPLNLPYITLLQFI